MNPLYNLGIRLYGMGVKVAAMRGHDKAAKMVRGHAQTFDRLRQFVASDPGRPVVWLHVSSLGEFEQGRPLMERIRADHPGARILLTFFSPSGYEVRCNYPGADCVAYLPFDTPANARRFVSLVRPAVTFFVKYEFWGNYLTQLLRRKVPVYLVSGIFRPGQIFFRPWGREFRKMLYCFRHLFVQDERSRQLLAGVGVNAVTVVGDTRFDRVSGALHTPLDQPALEAWRKESDRPLLIVGSSWEADEDIYIPWLAGHTAVRTVIAPHEFDAERLAALRSRLPGNTVLWSEVAANGGTVPTGTDNFIIDTFGLLSKLYRLADVTYIGGGFGAGIHNIAEAAVYGVPVLFGPRHAKFREAGEMIDCGGAFSFADAEGFNAVANRLFGDADARMAAGKAAGDYIARNLGATGRILDAVDLTVLDRQ